MKIGAGFKALIRDGCSELLARSGATQPASRLRQRLSIVTFHRVLSEEDRRRYPLPGLAVTPQELDEHLRFLTRHFECTTLSHAVGRWKRRETGDRPLLAITFDDGQRDNYVNALPVLERHGTKASFFVTSGTLEDTRPLWHDALALLICRLQASNAQNGDSANRVSRSKELLAEVMHEPPAALLAGQWTIETAVENTKRWSAEQRSDWMERAAKLLPTAPAEPWEGFMGVQELKHLLTLGHEVGSHSHSHALLPQCDESTLHLEIAGSRQRLEQALQAPVHTFCYPNGSVDSRCVDHVTRAGYLAAVTTQWGSNTSHQHPALLRRFDMNARHAADRHGHFSEARLAWRMSGLHPGLSSQGDDLYARASV
jgi:peptidoglycan/xylan/chitin deacetylase (PgdA/CDA1 family)